VGLLVMILGLVLFFAAHVFTTKRETRAQAEKYFWKNAARVYKYVKRAANQPGI